MSAASGMLLISWGIWVAPSFKWDLWSPWCKIWTMDTLRSRDHLPPVKPDLAKALLDDDTWTQAVYDNYYHLEHRLVPSTSPGCSIDTALIHDRNAASPPQYRLTAAIKVAVFLERFLEMRIGIEKINIADSNDEPLQEKCIALE